MINTDLQCLIILSHPFRVICFKRGYGNTVVLGLFGRVRRFMAVTFSFLNSELQFLTGDVIVSLAN